MMGICRLSLTPSTHLRGVKVLGTIRIFLEQLASTVAEQLVVCNLKFKSTGAPFLMECEVVRVNERDFLVYEDLSKCLG